MTPLLVDFAGEQRHVTDSLTFGRAGDLALDNNEYMHRWVGEFFCNGSLWWLRNRGSRIPLTLVSDDGKTVELPPGAVQALSGGRGVVRFRAGQANYELSYEGVVAEPDTTGAALADNAELTRAVAIQLTPREVDYLVTFAAPQFNKTGAPLPTYADVAATWEVSVKTLDNTLQNLRRKVKEAGLRGVDSLDSLVTFAIAHGLITRADLDWATLDRFDAAPQPAGGGPRFASR